MLQQARKFLSHDKELKGKNFAVTFYELPRFIKTMKIFVIKIIKLVVFNMNSMFIKVTFNSFIFVIDIFCTGPASTFGIIGITSCHGASFC